MSNPKILEDTLIKWAATRPDQVLFNPSDAYYSFDIVADAFEKGKQHGFEKGQEQAIREGREHARNQLIEATREKYFASAKLTSEAFGEMLKFLKESGYSARKLFINASIKGAACIFSVDETIYLADEFIDIAYAKLVELETKYYLNGLDLQMSFINNDTEINYELLRSDGYDFAINIDDATLIY
jgi:hypothetical protein